MDLVEKLRKKVRAEHLKTGEQALAALKELIRDMLAADAEMDLSGSPAVILVIGVNGCGQNDLHCQTGTSL